MIEVRCFPSGDRAEAECPESALVAALTLCADDFAARPLQGRNRSVMFLVEGKLVAECRERDLWAVKL